MSTAIMLRSLAGLTLKLGKPGSSIESATVLGKTSGSITINHWVIKSGSTTRERMALAIEANTELANRIIDHPEFGPATLYIESTDPNGVRRLYSFWCVFPHRARVYKNKGGTLIKLNVHKDNSKPEMQRFGLVTDCPISPASSPMPESEEPKYSC